MPVHTECVSTTVVAQLARSPDNEYLKSTQLPTLEIVLMRVGIRGSITGSASVTMDVQTNEVRILYDASVSVMNDTRAIGGQSWVLELRNARSESLARMTCTFSGSWATGQTVNRRWSNAYRQAPYAYAELVLAPGVTNGVLWNTVLSVAVTLDSDRWEID